MLRLFQSFIAKMKAGFHRIAKATRNEMTVDDLHNDAWIIALDIGERRGRPIDFADPADQDLVMRSVNLQNVRRGDWNMRRSVRIDQEPKSDEGLKWVERLPARASSDPLVFLLARESARDIDGLLAASYSQATAYAITFSNLKNNRRTICKYLAVSDGALTRRAAGAADTMKRQSSIFDRIERVPSTFMPLRGQHYAAKTADMRESRQGIWTF
jgi:hypothetical protein